ncbi:hypothetical protein ACIQI7_22180 [Kitasatospora sp. NPDC092039]|uniref:hypothetical protein n=1 Tax=Kitasatospora sp. NPDC092039 TaxID=3364086 RepID=UPI003818F22B
MNTPFDESLALRTRANALLQQEALLPATGPAQIPDAVQVGQQIAELGTLIRELGGEFSARAAEQPAPGHAIRAAMAYAEAIGSLGEASAALGTVAQQLGFLGETAEIRHLPWAREGRKDAVRAIEYAVETARDELRHGSRTLNQAALHLSPPAEDLRRQAALSRSANASAPAPADPGGPAPAPAAAAVHADRRLR